MLRLSLGKCDNCLYNIYYPIEMRSFIDKKIWLLIILTRLRSWWAFYGNAMRVLRNLLVMYLLSLFLKPFIYLFYGIFKINNQIYQSFIILKQYLLDMGKGTLHKREKIANRSKSEMKEERLNSFRNNKQRSKSNQHSTHHNKH
jgi:hypothetical protein